jgi:hypothetical protein
MKDPVEPSISKAAFSCPHCGAYTTQYWHLLRSVELPNTSPTPSIPGAAQLEFFTTNSDIPDAERYKMIDWVKKRMSGSIFFEDTRDGYIHNAVENLNLSKCHHCSKIAVWVHTRMVYPESKSTVIPNQDLPEEIITDFEEARSIVSESPRGAAALLRLCVQKLCIHLLGQESTDINRDIALLVKKGLNPTIQQALDVVRVIGNESVHPGELDMKDDRDTAIALFGLVNSITNQLITHPKEVAALYGALPPNKLKGIETRDKITPPTMP